LYQLLSDLHIVECASFIAAPSCALHLQQFGAEVIRVDPTGGGPDFKRWPVSPDGHSFYWEGLNKGKRSIAINLSSPQGRALAIDLITAPGPGRGMFVTNFPKDGFLAHAALRPRRSDLITVRVSGWGDGSSALDYTVNAAIGVPHMTGPADSPQLPVNHVLPAWDLLTGAYAAFAALAAERQRRMNGQGQEILVPLSDMALASLGHMGQIAEVLAGGDRPRMGNALYGAFGRDFATRDDERVMVVAITARQWTGLLASLQLHAPISALEATLQVSFAHDEGIRFTHRDVLFPIFERAIGAFTLPELQTRFDQHGVCWGPYRTLRRGLVEDPRLSLQRPLFDNLEHPSGYRYPAPGAAASLEGMQRGPVVRAPKLGEHTDQVLAEVLSMSSAQIGALHDAGTVASAKE
jgi:2-methylfumaryl-CoA isomerase